MGKYSGRDSAQYDGTERGLKTKLELLELISQAEDVFPRDPDDVGQVDDDDDMDADDNPEAIDEDHSKIDSLRPFTCSYLDLSSLDLKHRSNRFPCPLFLYRRDYDDISRLINKRHRSGHGSVIVSGQPGTGEVFVSSSRRN